MNKIYKFNLEMCGQERQVLDTHKQIKRTNVRDVCLNEIERLTKLMGICSI